jgi:hypothetical protein
MTAISRKAGWRVRALGLLGPALAMAWAAPALAGYFGDSFISIPGVEGHWRGGEHKGWIRIEAHDWQGRIMRLNSGATDPLAGDKLFFGGPNVVKPGTGGGRIIVSMGKRNPDLARLMRSCASKEVIPELTYSESSDLARPVLELGPRPADLPAWWRYKLKQVQVVDCPVLAGARDQALILAFKDIEWLNYDPARPTANRITVRPEDVTRVRPAQPVPGKQVKAWLITWIAPATTTTDDECPQLNAKPSEADVFRYLTPEEAALVRSRFGDKGLTYGGESERRGPLRISVGSFPGIVPDPGNFSPVTRVALGIDLDSKRGREDFTSPDGRQGIDNQLLRVTGCVPGMRGRRGYANQTPNARRADGNIVTLIEVSGIDDLRNDPEVEIALIHSKDRPVKDNSGKNFIPNYSYRPTDNPNFALFNLRVKGRIVNGVFESEQIPRYFYTPGQGASTEFFDARIRLEPQEDGSVKGYLAGYVDWRRSIIGSGYSEGLFNFRSESLYYAYRRYADGLRDPLTGEMNGISTVFEIDTVPAFLVPDAPTQARGQ